MFPKFLPRKLPRSVTLSGYFFPPSQDVQCVFKHESSTSVIVTQIDFKENNRTSVTCTIALPKLGLWTLGLRTSRSIKDLHISEDIVIYSFEKESISFTSLSPSKLLISDTKESISLEVKPSSPESTPIVPLVCRICSMKPGSTWEITSQAGSKPFSCLIPPDERLQTSQELTISFTFDGGEVLGSIFKLKVTASVPSVSTRTSFISSDGITAVVSFENAIDISEFGTHSSNSLCRQILALRQSRLEPLECVWAAKNQFIIYLKKPILEMSVDVTFNPGVLKEDSQDIRMTNEDDVSVTLAKLTSEWFLYSPRVIITGPTQVPSCGIFVLSPYLSVPQGSWGTVFDWSLGKEHDLSQEAFTKVAQFLELVQQNENLVLPSELLNYDIEYTFKLTVKLIDGTSLSAKHTVIRLPVEAPIVSIYSTSMLTISPVTLDQSVTLISQIMVPHCVAVIQQVYLTWYVSDVRVRFNFTHAYFPIYQIAPFAMAYLSMNELARGGNETEVTFGVNAFFGHRYKNATKATIKLNPLDIQFSAIINDGATMITLGTSGGWLQLSALDSGCKEKDEPLVYQWSCSDGETHAPCYDHSPQMDPLTKLHKEASGYLLIDRTLQSKALIRLDASSLPPKRDLFFSLKVFQANYPLNGTRKVSETELLLVKTVPGDPPQVSIGPILINDAIKANIRSPHNLAFLVPEHTTVTIKGKVIKSVSQLKSITWSSPNLPQPPAATHISLADDLTMSQMVIPSEFIHPYSVHVVKLKACNMNDECSEAITQFTVTQGITGCYLLVDPYTELSFPVKVEVNGCNIPPGLSPVTFQILASDSETRSVSSPSFDRVFFLAGIPSAFSSVVFTVRVCDVLNNCKNFESTAVEVQESANATKSAIELMDQVKKYSRAGGLAEAVAYLIPILMAHNENKSTEYNSVVQAAIDYIIEYTVDSLQRPSFIISTGHTGVFLRALNEAARRTNDSSNFAKVLAAIHKVALKARGMRVKLDTNELDSVVQTIVNKFNQLTLQKDTDGIQEQAQLALAALFSSVSTSLALGERLELGQFVQLGQTKSHEDQVPPCYTVIVHDSLLQDMTLSTHLNSTTEVSVAVTFGQQLRGDFSPPWHCDGSSGCNSVIFAVSLYPRGGPFHSIGADYLTRITPVVSVKIFSPSSGREQPVKGYLSAVSLTFSLTGNSSYGGSKYDTKCLYWNRMSQSWEPDGVHLLLPFNTSSSNVTCWSGHLTEFAVFRVRDSIAGMVTGVALFLLLILLTLFFTCACIMRKDPSRSKIEVLDETTSIRL